MERRNCRDLDPNRRAVHAAQPQQVLGDAALTIELFDKVVPGLRVDEAGCVERLDDGFGGVLGIPEDCLQVRVGSKRRGADRTEGAHVDTLANGVE
jgi:hypothetical protein